MHICELPAHRAAPSPMSPCLWQLDVGAAAAGRDWWLRNARISAVEIAAAEVRGQANARLTFIAGRALAFGQVRLRMPARDFAPSIA